MRYRHSAMIGRISLRARAAALLPLAALGVHDLRYRLAYGGDAGHELARQGHAYLGIAKPLVGVLCALAAAEAVARLARAWRIGEAGERSVRAVGGCGCSRPARWSRCSSARNCSKARSSPATPRAWPACSAAGAGSRCR